MNINYNNMKVKIYKLTNNQTNKPTNLIPLTSIFPAVSRDARLGLK